MLEGVLVLRAKVFGSRRRGSPAGILCELHTVPKGDLTFKNPKGVEKEELKEENTELREQSLRIGGGVSSKVGRCDAWGELRSF